jgi:hypothetical protein
VTGGLAGAELRVDGRSVGALPSARPVRLPAGISTVAVVADDRVLVTRAVSIVAGLTTREDLSTPVAAATARSASGASVTR